MDELTFDVRSRYCEYLMTFVVKEANLAANVATGQSSQPRDLKAKGLNPTECCSFLIRSYCLSSEEKQVDQGGASL